MKKLRNERWTSTDVHSVIWALLRSEYLKKGNTFEGHKYVNNGDMSPEHCFQRMRLLYNTYRRRFLWGELPLDTQWYRVTWLRDRHLKEIRAISHCDLDGAGGLPIPEGAKKIGWNLRDDQDLWDCPILFANKKEGPYTVLEGNHRLLGWKKKHPRGRSLRVPIYVGISKLPCFWHGGEQVFTNDLWLQRARKA